MDKVKGSIYGVAVGDAIGAPCEFMSPSAVAIRYGTVDKMIKSYVWQKGEFTDDTWLTIATTYAYENKTFNPERAGEAMLVWMKNVGKGIGTMTARALGNISGKRCTVFDAGKKALASNPHNGAGNGSLMRCASTGLIHSPDKIDLIVKESTILSEITHADPRCVASCVAYNIILSHIANDKTLNDALPLAIDEANKIDKETADILIGISNGTGNTFDLNDQKNRGFVLRSFQRALISLRDGSNFKDEIVKIINEGGDADTNGAIAGGLLGAKFGFDSIPIDWIDPILNKTELDEAIEIINRSR